MSYGRWRRLLHRSFKFYGVGGLGVGIQLGALSLATGFFGIHYLVGTVAAVESAILHNFFWHERWTWSDRRLLEAPGRLQRLLRFNGTTGLVSILGNVAFMRLYVGALGLPYWIGNLASIASCGLANFILSDRLVFLPEPGPR